jgi:4-hydroxy-3-methylbut-2-enyl diphosphate reductase
MRALMTEKPPLNLLLAAPRGFCAGVVRAIDIVERALETRGAPVFVRHEIVHNRRVVQRLEAKGARFVDDLDQVPDDAAVVFSAHGVPKSVHGEAARRSLDYLDATCPLVSKVHREAEHHFAAGRKIVLIGHSGHPEVIGTLGQLPEGAIRLVERAEDVAALPYGADQPLAFITQTTLSVDDTADIVAALRRRYPRIAGPAKEDICYATSNRQAAVKAIAPQCDVLLVVGADNSSNSRRLAEVAGKSGCPRAFLVGTTEDVPWDEFAGARTIGLTAGASAPEELVGEIVDAFRERYDLRLEEIAIIRENVHFRLPRALEV